MDKQDSDLTRALMKEIQAWMEKNKFPVHNKERTMAILYDDKLTWQDLPMLHGRLGRNLERRLNRVIEKHEINVAP